MPTPFLATCSASRSSVVHRSTRPVSPVGPWLYGIATNLIARHRRSEARRLRAMASLTSPIDERTRPGRSSRCGLRSSSIGGSGGGDRADENDAVVVDGEFVGGRLVG